MKDHTPLEPVAPPHHCTASVQATRLALTLEAASFKLFLGAGIWEACGLYVSNVLGWDGPAYAFATGVGEAFGVFIGATLCVLWRAVYMRFVEKRSGADTQEFVSPEMLRAVWLGAAAFWSGAAWWPIVSLFQYALGWNFTATIFGTAALEMPIFW